MPGLTFPKLPGICRDIGGGTRTPPVLSWCIVCNISLRIGGDKFDEAIVRYVRKEYNLMIGERTAEEIKIRIGSANVNEKNKDKKMEVRGRDLVTGLPKTIIINTAQSWDALQEPVEAVIEGVKKVLEITPPELAADILNNGIVMTGGGSLLEGLDILLSKRTNLPVHIADEPISCVAMGTGKSLEQIALLSKARSKGPRRVG